MKTSLFSSSTILSILQRDLFAYFLPFRRRLTLTPALPIRFNYHGHQLDLSQVSKKELTFKWCFKSVVLSHLRFQGPIIGLLALCLRLKNAELILPQWVYQRGYRGVYSLMEEVTSHWTSTLHSNLLQILATSIGPMNEISSIRESSISQCLSVFTTTRLSTSLCLHLVLLIANVEETSGEFVILLLAYRTVGGPNIMD